MSILLKRRDVFVQRYTLECLTTKSMACCSGTLPVSTRRKLGAKKKDCRGSWTEAMRAARGPVSLFAGARTLITAYAWVTLLSTAATLGGTYPAYSPRCAHWKRQPRSFVDARPATVRCRRLKAPCMFHCRPPYMI